MENITIQQLNDLFKVKVQHKIYTFNTDTIPDYLKIGDTYRQVAIRLNEWKRVYQNLRPNQIFSAEINNEVFFRDTAVHQYLHEDKSKHIVTQQEVQGVTPYCTELFRADNISDGDIDEAIGDIKQNYSAKTLKYPFYKIDSRKRVSRMIERNQTYKLRLLQESAVISFMRAINDGRRNLLMYAVMRFGKSFTAMQCAKKYAEAGNPLNFIVITSAKKVENEWERTIKSHLDFSNFVFVNDNDLAENYNIVPDLIAEGKKVVLFLTLQTLNKKKVADRHKQVFDTPIDMLFVDETHYGARGDQLGTILDINTATEVKNKLRATINLHLSGTPYRILQNGEFEDEDIIAFCQFSDITKAKIEWEIVNKAKIDNPEDETEIWDNPYFGFPEMIRFAFNTSEVSRVELTELEQDGLGYFENLFATLSDNRNNDNHRKFVNESDVLTLFKTIDGAEAGNPLLSFLQYEGLKAAELCKHIVCVLPRCTACDALAKLLTDHSHEFINLGEYKIINISGLDTPYTGDYVEKVRRQIAECERRGDKTISLTVGKMLTGITVEHWDSMFYLKDTMSPQEYDQATFRIQSPYVENSLQINATGKSIKIDKKPQTLLVDFHPARMLFMQASNIDKLSIINKGNKAVDYASTAQESLTISPIICLNKDRLQKIDAQTIVNKIIEYSREKSVMDETGDMSISQALLSDNNVKIMLNHHPELNIKTGIKHNPNEDAPTTDLTGLDTIEDTRHKTPQTTTQNTTNPTNNDINSLRKRLNACIAKMLFYVYLSGEKCANLEDVIASINRNERNIRIANNFKIIVEDLILLNSIAKGNDKAQLVKAITTTSKLSCEDFTSIEKAKKAIHKFNRFSSSEIVTPLHICKDMLKSIGEEKLIEIINNDGKLLDIASKAGEFALALFEMLQGKVNNEKLVKAIYSIPTSTEAYEFTRYTYEKLGLCVENIATKFTSYDLLIKEDRKNDLNYTKIKRLLLQNKNFSLITLDDKITEGDTEMQFAAIVGNPPYQENVSTAKGNSSLGKQLFPGFIKIAASITKKYATLITPSKWFTSEGQDGSFPALREFIKANNHIRYIRNYSDNYSIFESVNFGAVNYFLYDTDYTGNVSFNDGDSIVERPLFEDGLDIILTMQQMVSIVNKVRGASDFQSLMNLTQGRDAFGIPGKKEYLLANTKEKPFENCVSVRCAYEQIRYIAKDKIKNNMNIVEHYKVFTSKGNGAAGTLDINSANAIIGKAYVGEPNSACSDSLIPIGCFDTIGEAENLAKYMATKFLRFMVGTMKTSRNIYQVVYRFVPIQDFTANSDIDWSRSISKIDVIACEKYGYTTINEVDAQLYDKYNLSADEVQFIEKVIKTME